MMREAITSKIFLDEAGSFMGRGGDCLIVRDKKGKWSVTFADRPSIILAV
jgi:hypothetical protein